jgi:hypothetical protein
VLKYFVGGDFVNGLHMPCNEDDANDPKKTVSVSCKAWAQQMQATYAALVGDSQRLGIREALASWPKDSPQPPQPPSPPRPPLPPVPPPAALPDLVIVSGGRLPPQISNVGNAAAGPFHLSIQDSPSGPARTSAFTGLVAGARVSTSITCRSGRVFTVDPGNEVTESNESNNTFMCP